MKSKIRASQYKQKNFLSKQTKQKQRNHVNFLRRRRAQQTSENRSQIQTFKMHFKTLIFSMECVPENRGAWFGLWIVWHTFHQGETKPGTFSLVQPLKGNKPSKYGGTTTEDTISPSHLVPSRPARMHHVTTSPSFQP